MDETLKRDQNFVTVLAGVTNDVDQDITMLRVDPITKRLLVASSGGGGGVTSLNGLTGAVTLSAGSNITLTPVGNDIEISATGGGTPTLTDTQIAYGDSSNLITSSAELTYVSSTGVMTLTKSSTSPVSLYVDNSETANTAADSHLRLRTGGAGGGDPHIQFSVAGVQSWTAGIDNSNSDIFIISADSQPGTLDRLRISVAGAMQLPVYGAGSITGTTAKFASFDSSGNIIEVASPIPSTLGGTGVAQASASSTLTLSGAFGLTFTMSGTTSLTLPTSGTLATLAGTETFTNKRITKRVLAITSNPTTPTVNTDSYDVVHITSQTNNMAFGANFTGTPVDGDTLRISVTSSSGSPTMTWSSLFESSTITLPAVTNGTARIDIGFFWNSETSKWRCVSTS